MSNIRVKAAHEIISERAVKTLSIEATWQAAVKVLEAVLVDGSPEGKAQARAELQRCAAIADACGPLFDIVLSAQLRETQTGARVLQNATRAAMKRAQRIMTEAGCFAGDNAKPREVAR